MCGCPVTQCLHRWSNTDSCCYIHTMYQAYYIQSLVILYMSGFMCSDRTSGLFCSESNHIVTHKPFSHYRKSKYFNKSFFMEPTDPIGISRIITSLKPKNSSGHDGISSKLLKCLNPSISNVVCTIINKSLVSGTVPRSMKAAKVIPIYK